MLKNLNATKKGLITGLIMIGMSLAIYYSGQPFDSPLQYLIYAVYAGGIIWTLFEFSKSEENTNKFAAFFLQGFKCFIVIALLMVVFTFLFNKMHPEFKDTMAKAYSDDLIKKGNKTPAEILQYVEKAKDFYLTMMISGAIFGYLMIGAVITAAASLLFMKRK
jgi:uncharacterized protein YozE (UPF0346 family)